MIPADGWIVWDLQQKDPHVGALAQAAAPVPAPVGGPAAPPAAAEGEAVSGLRLVLSAEKSTTAMYRLAPGAMPVPSTLTFRNASDKPIQLDTYDLVWRRLAIEVTEAGGARVAGVPWTTSRQPPKPRPADFPAIPPGGSWSYDFGGLLGGLCRFGASEYHIPKPGAYRIKLTYSNPAEAPRDDPLAAGCWVGRLVSNEIVLTVLAADATPALLPGSRLSVEQACKDEFAFAAACEALEEARELVGFRTPDGVFARYQVFRVLAVLGGRVEEVDRAHVDYTVRDKPDCRERFIAKGERVIWMGHTRRSPRLAGLKALSDTPENREAVLKAVRDTRAWGEPANGVRLRIETAKPVYMVGEDIAVFFIFENVSDKDLVILDAEGISPSWMHKFEFWDEAGKEIAQETPGLDNKGEKLILQTLRPGQHVEHKVKLNPWKLAGLGHPCTEIGKEARTFVVMGSYHSIKGLDLKLPNGWGGWVRSNRITIAIVGGPAQRAAEPQGALSSSKAAYSVGEFPTLTFRLENVGPGEKEVQEHPWFGGSPYGATFVSAPDGKVYPLRLRRILGAGRPKHSLAVGAAETAEVRLDHAKMSVMYQGNYHDFLLWVLSLHGEFTAWFVYGDPEGRLASNKCVFRIDPPPDDAPWSAPADGLRLLTRVTSTEAFDFLVTSFWNVGDRPIAIHTWGIGWELKDAAGRTHRFSPLSDELEFVTHRERDEDLGPLLPKDRWRLIPPGTKLSTMQVLSTSRAEERARLQWNWFGVQPFGFTFPDPGSVPKPWAVASVYSFDLGTAKGLLREGHERFDGLDDRAWTGRATGNAVSVQTPVPQPR
jgi:hypothetical protein